MKFLLRSLLALSLITPACAQDIIPPSPTATGTAVTGQIPGTTTNDNASSGKIGESIESEIPLGSSVSLTTGTPANVTSISLTAGDWDVSATAWFDGDTTTTLRNTIASIGATSATLSTAGSNARFDTFYSNAGVTPFSQQDVAAQVGPTRISLSATTTIYLVVDAIFATSTMATYGTIYARRVR